MSEAVDRSSRSRGGLALIGFLAATFLVDAMAVLLVLPAIDTWYAKLTKPSFNPPNAVFGPVWTVLYALMAIAAWQVWKAPSSRLRRAGLIWYWIQLALNFLWSVLFFKIHRVDLALAEIVVLWAAILVTMILFFSVRKLAGWMFVPYLAWVSFASVLNFLIWLKS
jgi:translocator protein